ncbi:hypothetical protein KAJ27_13610 [bacterium]|nr:hypothetical protein [bacterium]
MKRILCVTMLNLFLISLLFSVPIIGISDEVLPNEETSESHEFENENRIPGNAILSDGYENEMVTPVDEAQIDFEFEVNYIEKKIKTIEEFQLKLQELLFMRKQIQNRKADHFQLEKIQRLIDQVEAKIQKYKFEDSLKLKNLKK